MKIVCFVTFIFFSILTNVFADSVLLKDGEKLEGKIVERSDKYIRMDPGVGVVMTYYDDEIETIDGQKLQTTVPATLEHKDQPPAQTQANIPTASDHLQAPEHTEDEDLSQAKVLISNESYDQAIAILNKLVENGSTNALVYGFRGLCLENQKDYDGAIKDFYKSNQLNQEQARQFYKSFGFAYLQNRNWAQAEEWFRSYLQYFPEDGESFYGIAIARYHTRDYVSASNYLNEALQTGKEDTLGLRNQITEAKAEQDEQYHAQHNTYYRSSSSNSNKDIAYALVFLILGVSSFFNGLRALLKKRAIENIPRSTVRGLAMGLVELNGKAKKTKTLQAPLSATECTFYRYLIQRYESNGKSSRWVEIAKGDSAFCPFSLDDSTGQVMVLPKGAEFVMPVDYTFTTSLGSGLPNNIVNFMGQNGIQYRGVFGNYTLRFMEWYIKPEEAVFVVGTALKNADLLDDHRENLSARVDELRQNLGQAPLDSNQEAGIGPEGWKRAAANAEHQLLQEETKLDPQEDQTDVIVAKGDGSQIFIISDESQKDVLKAFSWQAFSGIWGGAALSLAMLAYLLFRFGLWSRF